MKLRSAESGDVAEQANLPRGLLKDLRSLIESARERVAAQVNAEITLLYWQVGNRIRKDILKERRAGYAERMLPTLSAELQPEFGKGFGARNLANMVRFADAFPDPQILQTLSAKLSWSHFVEIIRLKDDLQRQFYAEMCRVERWSVRTLHSKISGMLFERTGIAKKPEELARKELDQLREEDQLTPDLVFRDPYFLDFLQLSDTFSEKSGRVG